MSSSAEVALHRVFVADAVSEGGLAVLRDRPGFQVEVRTGLKPEALAAVIGGYDALIVRSATRVTAQALATPGRLKVIGRAGTGVDNIDMEAATRAGIVVLNTPGGNATAAAEQTMCLLLGLARHVAPANADLRAGRWERKAYTGVELAGKTLGVLGLGRIGREVVRAALGLRMRVVAFDPYVPEAATADLGIARGTLEEVLAGCDFLTLHLPLVPETRRIVDAAALRRMRRGARLVNCARGGLVDEAALLAALESGHLAGAALDVFEEEPPSDLALARHPRVLATPHLGASTVEAQERVGTEIAEKVRDYLERGHIVDAVNFPAVPPEEQETLPPMMALAERLGRFASQAAEGAPVRLELRVFGEFARGALQPLVLAATKGLLAPVLSGGVVTHVNALALAASRGITVEQGRSTEPSPPYAGLVRLSLVTERETFTVAGTLLARAPRLTEVDGLPLESGASGPVLLFRNQDVPGVVGRVGTLLGEAAVNIAGVQLGRTAPGAQAVFLVDVDQPVSSEVLERLRAVPGIVRVRALTL
jgi:D-3-phosphoglycerate dehydrogenase